MDIEPQPVAVANLADSDIRHSASESYPNLLRILSLGNLSSDVFEDGLNPSPGLIHVRLAGPLLHSGIKVS